MCGTPGYSGVLCETVKSVVQLLWLAHYQFCSGCWDVGEYDVNVRDSGAILAVRFVRKTVKASFSSYGSRITSSARAAGMW